MGRIWPRTCACSAIEESLRVKSKSKEAAGDGKRDSKRNRRLTKSHNQRNHGSVYFPYNSLLDSGVDMVNGILALFVDAGGHVFAPVLGGLQVGFVDVHLATSDLGSIYSKQDLEKINIRIPKPTSTRL